MMVRIYVVLAACKPGCSIHAVHHLTFALYAPWRSSAFQRLPLHKAKEQQSCSELLQGARKYPGLRFLS